MREALFDLLELCHSNSRPLYASLFPGICTPSGNMQWAHALLAFCLILRNCLTASGSFTLQDDRFVLDGKPLQLISGRCETKQIRIDACSAVHCI